VALKPARGGTNGEHALLASCYRQSIALAAAHEARSIAFPAISTGVFGFPFELASPIAVTELASFLAANATFEKALLVAFRDEDARMLRRALDTLPGGTTHR
jgi:O-acetyl-ADP-ribose deacetylase